MIDIVKVISIGQINIGDQLLIIVKNKKIICEAKSIVKLNLTCEEIIIHKRHNKYFAINLMLQGDSWVDEVYILKGCISLRKS